MAGEQQQTHRGRFLSLAIVLISAIVLVSSDAGRHAVREVFTYAEGVITTYPRGGVLVFVVLSALSAMLAFFSTAILLPVAIYVWGERTAFGLLWLGWFLGGLGSYALGKWLGRDVVRWIIPERRLAAFERPLAKNVTFGRVLLFHLMVPSELPGYVLGLLKYPFRRYVLVLAIAEVPFAAAAIYLASSFVQGNLPLLLALSAAGIAVSIISTRYFIKHSRAAGDE